MLTLDQVKNYLDREFIRKLYAQTDGIDVKDVRATGEVQIGEGLHFGGDPEDTDSLSGFVGPWHACTLTNGWAPRTEDGYAAYQYALSEWVMVLVRLQSDTATDGLAISGLPQPVDIMGLPGMAVTFRQNGTVQAADSEVITVLPDGTADISSIAGWGPNIDYIFSGIYSLVSTVGA